MNKRWTLEDLTGKNKGYLSVRFNGMHVADVFPFGAGRNPEHTISRAKSVVDILNAVDGWRRISHKRDTPHGRLLDTDEGQALMRAVDGLLTIRDEQDGAE